MSEMLSEITVQRRDKWMIAILDIAKDVLDHNNRVVHHEARGDRQSHQREIVEAETRQIHHGEGAKQGKRQRHARDDRGTKPAEKQE